MELFSKKILSNDNTLIIDINDFSFEAAIFSGGRGANYKFIEFLEKGVLIHENMEATVHNIEIQMKRALRKIIDKAALSNKKIGLCFIIFSPMWRISESHLVKIKKDIPFVFTKKDFDELLKNEDSVFLKNLKETFNSKRLPEGQVGLSAGQVESSIRQSGSLAEKAGLKFIEADIMNVLLNGYPSQTPFDKSVKTIELHIFISAIETKFFDFINNLLKTRLNLSFEENTLLLKSAAGIFFIALKDFLPRMGALLVNVGAEITEIIFIKNGYIEEIARFNKGTDFFVRRIASDFKISSNLAESYFERFQNNLLDAGIEEKLKNIISGSARDFQSHFLAAAREISVGHFLPQDLFFLSLKILPQDLFALKNQNKDALFNVHRISLSELFPEKENFCYNNSGSSLCLPSIFLNKYLNYVSR